MKLKKKHFLNILCQSEAPKITGGYNFRFKSSIFKIKLHFIINIKNMIGTFKKSSNEDTKHRNNLQ